MTKLRGPAFAALTAVSCVAGAALWAHSSSPPTPMAAARPGSAVTLCSAVPRLVARDQMRALRPAFHPVVAGLRTAPYYQLALTPSLPDHRLTVREALCYTNATGDRLTTLALHLYDNYPIDNGFRPTHLSVNGHAAAVSVDPHDPTFALLTLPAPLQPGQSIDLQLILVGQLPVATADAPTAPAMQFLDGGGLGQFPHYLTLAWAYAQVGVYANHRWSHPVLTPHVDILSAPIAFFDATVALPHTYGLVSSGITLSTAPYGKTQRIYHVVTGPVRDLTLEAGPRLTSVTVHAADVRIESAYVPSSARSAAATAQYYAKLVRAALPLASRLFTPYPYAKITLAEAPIGASGLQWSTLIQIQNNQYLPHPWAPPGLPGVTLSSSEGVFLAHEVSHQWWYGLVGNDQVDNGFLSEGLATFSQMFLPVEQARHVQPRLVAAAWRHVLQDRRARVLDAYWSAGGRDVVINQPAVNAPNADPHYANYEKASAFFTLYSTRFGRAALLTFLHRYAAQNMFRVATLDDLQDALMAAAPGHAAAVAQMVTNWFRHPNLAQEINPRAVAPTPTWQLGVLAQLHAAVPQLRTMTLSPEDEIGMGLGIEPFDAAVRPYVIPLGPSAAIARMFASLRAHEWVTLAPMSGGLGVERVECRRGGELIALIAAAPESLPAAQQRLLKAQVPHGQTVVVVEAKQE